MAKNVIELNGQKYDALTGSPITISTPTASTHAKAPKLHSGPKNMDGFTRRPASTHPSSSKTQKTQTLMRHAVKKPAANAKIHSKTGSVAPVKPVNSSAHRSLLDTEKPGRVIRAANIAKSNLVSKFGGVESPVRSAVLPVAEAPIEQQPQPSKQALATPTTPRLEVTSSAQQKTAFDNAVEQAISHEQPRVKKAKSHHRIAKKLHVSPRLVSFVGTAFVAVGIAGFLVQQNLPELAMKLASTRAGLNASLPSYQPAGFAMTGPIEYEPGEVKLSYKSNTDERSFEVIQKNSSWNSETLLDNFVTTTEQPYQTFQANGRTIYIYEGNKATWVDGGIWYSIDGKANLNSDQLLRIAGSL